MLIPNNDVNDELDNFLIKNNDERESQILELKKIKINSLKLKILKIFEDQKQFTKNIENHVKKILKDTFP